MAELEEIRGVFFYRKLYLKAGHGSPCSSEVSEWTCAAAIKRATSREEVKAETKLIALLERGKAV